MISPRAAIWALLMAAACGSDARGSAPGGTGGTAGSNGFGAEGGTGPFGAGGSGASVGAGGDSGSGAVPPHDPALDCPAKPYAAPPAAEVIGPAPALASSSAIGSNLPDGVDDVASAPGGDVIVALWRRTGESSETLVERMKPDEIGRVGSSAAEGARCASRCGERCRRKRIRGRRCQHAVRDRRRYSRAGRRVGRVRLSSETRRGWRPGVVESVCPHRVARAQGDQG